MWKKTKEMKWKTAKLLWAIYFMMLRGRYCLRQGIYVCGKRRFCSRRNYGNISIAESCFRDSGRNTTLFINLPLIVISYRTLGKRFLLKTAKSMVITTFFLDVVFPVFPMYEGQRMMAALCSGALMGAGMVMFYMRGSSSGGLDFVIMPIKKKRPHLSVGKITMIIDLGIILLGWPVFGDVDAALYGLVSTFASVVVIDKVLYGLGAGTLAFVVTEKGDEVAAKIAELTKRGVTSVKATGTYTGKKKNVLLCACSKSEAFLVKCAAEEADENMFLMFMETSEVFGEGFRSSSD